MTTNSQAMRNPSGAVLEYPQRHAVSAEEYLRMAEAGVFEPGARLELIDGEIIEMSPIGSPHASVVNLLNRLLILRAGDCAIVSPQHPVVLSGRSVPQPDVALLEPRADSYFKSHPTAAEVLLAIEVADSTLAFDLGKKALLYAHANVRELWVVDVNARSIRVHRDPSATGYKTTFTVAGDDSVAILALPDVRIAVANLFPPIS